MNNANKKIFIVMAAFNEQKRIGAVLQRLKAAGYDNIVVVDDCSKDNTYGEALKHDVFVLRHVINRGQGASLQTGMSFALANGADIIINFDSDGQHRVEDIPAMLKPVLDGKADITLGSRFLEKKNAAEVPAWRRFTLRVAILVIRFFYGLPMTDAHNGFRVMTRSAAQKIKITSDRMEHASEIIDIIRKNKLRYLEVPVKILYDEHTLEHGHGSFRQGVEVGLRMLWRKLTE